jgi:hypothetical protein
VGIRSSEHAIFLFKWHVTARRQLRLATAAAFCSLYLPKWHYCCLCHLPDTVLNYTSETLVLATHFRQPARQTEPILTDGLHCAAHVRHVSQPGAYIRMGFKRCSTCSGTTLRLLVPVPGRGYLRHVQRRSCFCVVVTQVQA